MNTYKYRGFTIKPKLDFGGKGFLIKGKWVNTGWVVTDGFCNVLAGATWAQTLESAKGLIDAHIQADGDSTLFWKIVRARYAA